MSTTIPEIWTPDCSNSDSVPQRRTAPSVASGVKSLAVARAGCVKALTRLPAGRTVIKSGVECTMADIDEMAGLLTGNPEHFLTKRPGYG